VSCLLRLERSQPPPAHALGQQVGREEDITDLKLGQRVMVDDGNLPGRPRSRSLPAPRCHRKGVVRTRQCTARGGAKQR